MAAGIISVCGLQLPVASSGCTDVMAGLSNQAGFNNWPVISCSSDPVVAGSTILFTAAWGPTNCGVDSISATFEAPVSTGSTGVVDAMAPFYMDIDTAGHLGGALLLVMAVAWVFRQAVNLLRNSEGNRNDES